MFWFTPLLGARSTSPALQSLLEFDGGIKILIDVGWDIAFDAEALQELERQVPTISVILLTHATLSHVGAYAHCCKHIPLFSRIPVYATTPVISLSRTLLQDLYTSTPLASSFLPSSSIADSTYAATTPNLEHSNILLPPPTSEEIGEYFAIANQLKYLQPHEPIASSFSPPLNGLTITAYCAGHTLGGTIWHIQYGSESVVYAVDWHQGKENVFPGAAWLSGTTGSEVAEQLRQPTALICSSKGADTVVSGSRQQRDERLINHVRDTVRKGGNVLIPCDTSARALELAYILDKAWTQDRKADVPDSLQKSKLYFASSTASATLRYARSMLEWMDENIVREFEAASSAQAGKGSINQQPFEFKHLKLVERKSQLQRALAHSGPKVFLASDSTIAWGFSRDILDASASRPEDLILLTEALYGSLSGRSSLAARLGAILRQRATKGTVQPDVIQLNGDVIEVADIETSALTGNDMPLYQQYLARHRQRQDVTVEKGATTLETSADAVDECSEISSSSDEDSDTEHQGKSMNITAALTNTKHKLGLTDEELGINILLRRKDIHDFDVRGKKGRDKMFPFVAKRRRQDDFGDLIRPEEYLRAEEKDEADGQDMTAEAGKEKTTIGHKRKWGDQDDGPNDGKKSRLSGSGQKRRKGRDGHSRNVKSTTMNNANGATSEAEESEEEESDYEPAEVTVRGPMTASIKHSSLALKFKLISVDFSGVHDQRSLQMLIPLIKPRKLILTGGKDAETASLAETCKQLLSSSDASSSDAEIVFSPNMGVTVDASVDTNAWTIKLSQALYKKLQWQTFRSLGIVTVNGRLEFTQDDTEHQLDPETKRQKTDSTDQTKAGGDTTKQSSEAAPILNDLPVNLAGPTRQVNYALHVGDLRLAELRRIMQANGHTAEFKGEGTLLVDGLIAVRKSGIGKIEIESGGAAMPGAGAARMPGASFDHVKKKIYEGLALVAAR